MTENEPEMMPIDACWDLCLPKELKFINVCVENRGPPEILNVGATILYHNFIMKEVERHEDYSGKWFSKEAN